jgi:outer membrane protein assembly factor BamB
MNMNPKLSLTTRLVLFLAVVGAIVGLAYFASKEPVTAWGTPSPGPVKSSAPALEGRDWTMFGGTHSRNMVNTVERNMPTEWDIKTGTNIKWKVELGSQSYGNPVIANGKIFLGTNNDSPRDPNIKGDKGIIYCFRESDGKFLWQAVHDKLESGMVNDWPFQGVCSSPYVEGERLYYVSNRCELVCADVEGLANGNQGAQDEKYKGPEHADFIWRLDMMTELAVFPHNLAVCSPMVVGDLIFIVTGNGHDETHENIPAPQAPSFICVNKNTGKAVWTDNSPGQKILHGQWSNPCFAVIKGVPQVIFAGGDGWLRAFDPPTGKKLWKFDCNPKKAVYKLGSKGTRNYIIGTPVVYEDRVYISTGQDPEHNDGVGHLWCIDPTKAKGADSDLSPVNDNFDPKAEENKNSGLVWHVGGHTSEGELIWRRTISTCAIHDGLCYLSNLAGFLACFDAKTGEKVWEYDGQSQIWGSPYVVDGKIYLGNEEGDVSIFQAGRELKLIGKRDMRDMVYSTPVAANGVLYVMTKPRLYAIVNK